MQNPYNNKAMLPHDSDMFFGREKEMKSIQAALLAENPQSVSVVGERRIGKSSVANRLFHKLKTDNNTIAVFLDFDGLAGLCNSKEDFFQRLNDKFSESLAEKPQIQTQLQTFGFNDYPSFRGFVEKESKKGLKFIIFIDEFEHLPGKPFADDSFFSNLRAMANNPSNRLAFVTVSLNDLEKLTHKAVQSSGFWNIFDIQYIGLLDDFSVMQLRQTGFRQNNLPLSSQDIKKIVYYAGKFPFFNQMVCQHVFEAKVFNSETNWDNVEVKLRPYFETFWKHRADDEQKTLKSLITEGEVKKSFKIKEMLTRGILQEIKSEIYLPFSEFFFDLICEHFEIDRKMLQTIRGYYEIIKKEAKDILDIGKGVTGLFSGVDKKDSDEKDKDK